MGDFTAKMVDYVVFKVEDFHLPEKFNNTIVESNDDVTIIRSNLFNIEDVTQWVNDFSELTSTQWNARDSCPQGERFVCWKKFICHHSSFMKVPVTAKRSKSFSCEATLYIKIKLNNSKTRYTDPFIKAGQCAIIIIRNKHSHSLLAGEALSFLPSSKLTRRKFIDYFENGLGILESCHYHRSILKAEGYSELELISGRINPSQRTVRYWYNRWQKSNPFLIYELESKNKDFDTIHKSINTVYEEIENEKDSSVTFFDQISNSSSEVLESDEDFDTTHEYVNTEYEELENEKDSSVAFFDQISNSSGEVLQLDEIEDNLISSCFKINAFSATDFKEKKRKQEAHEISHLIYLNTKINEQLKISNSLKSQILKEIKTENYLKLKKMKFTCVVRKIGLGDIHSL